MASDLDYIILFKKKNINIWPIIIGTSGNHFEKPKSTPSFPYLTHTPSIRETPTPQQQPNQQPNSRAQTGDVVQLQPTE